MDPAALATQFGPLGLMIGYLIWREASTFKIRIEYDKARLETDKALAAALAALTTAILRGEDHEGHNRRGQG